MERLLTLLNNIVLYIRSVKFSCYCRCNNMNEPESPRVTPNMRHKKPKKLAIEPPKTKPPSNYVKNRIIKNSLDFNKTTNDSPSGNFSLHMSSSERS